MGILEGKIALVSGGTHGIGKATVSLFEKEGATCFSFGHKDYDISKEEEIKKLYNFFNDKYGKLDILVNNAGIYPSKHLEEITEEDIQKTFAINVNATMLMCKYFIPLLEKNNGVIVNNASIAGMQSFVEGKGSYIYASSKASVIQFSKLLAKNFAKKVRVNCICPGVIDTPIFENRDFSRYENIIPMGRVGKDIEVAEGILFLASEKASYITGTTLTIDGGMSL